MPGYEVIGKEERDAVNDVFDRGAILCRYGNNEKRSNIFKVDEFEKNFAEKFNVKHSLAVSSGTAALKTVLTILGVEPGDEVITQSHTFIATVEAIIETGAKPVITDINKTLNMDPEDLKEKITEKTKVIIPVHMAGVAAQMKEILSIAKKHDIYILEDNAQSPGGEYNGAKLGTLGDAGIFSFDFGKMLTTGEGGMIVTNDDHIFKKCREYADHGHELNQNFPRGRDTRSISGFNFKMMELQGAIGLEQIKKLDYVLQRHRENKKLLKDGISDIKNIEFREIPNPRGDIGDSLTILLENNKKAERFVKSWIEKGYFTKNLPDAINWHFAGTWDHIFHKYEEYEEKNLLELWKKSNDLLCRSIALPLCIKMSESDIKVMISSIKEIIKKI